MTAWDGSLAEELAAAKDAFGIREAGSGMRQALARAQRRPVSPGRDRKAWSASPRTGVTSPWRSTTVGGGRRGRTGLARGRRRARRAMIVAEHPELYHHPPARRATIPAIRGGGRDRSFRVGGPVGGAARQVRVGAGSSIGPRVVVDGPVSIGAGVRIEAGAILGCDGLYAKVVAGGRLHMPHFGGVDVGDDAFIHAGAVVVRSAIRGEATASGATRTSACCATSATMPKSAQAPRFQQRGRRRPRRIGARAWIGASATISNMVRVGDRADVRIGRWVIRDVPDGGDVSNNFARGHTGNMKRYLKELRDGSLTASSRCAAAGITCTARRSSTICSACARVRPRKASISGSSIEPTGKSATRTRRRRDGRRSWAHGRTRMAWCYLVSRSEPIVATSPYDEDGLARNFEFDADGVRVPAGLAGYDDRGDHRRFRPCFAPARPGAGQRSCSCG